MNRVGLKFDASDVDSVLVQLGLHHAGFFLATNDNKITSSGTLTRRERTETPQDRTFIELEAVPIDQIGVSHTLPDFTSPRMSGEVP